MPSVRRMPFWAWCLSLASGVFAQPETLPSEVAPQVAVTVRKHPMGADLVTMAAVAEDYPLDLMRAQAERVGAETGSPVRGLDVRREGSVGGLRTVRASFATDGLIDRESGDLHLQPLLRAFAGAPEPFTVRSLLIAFPDESPVEGRTLQDYRSESVAIQARVVERPPGIEVRALVFTQNRQAIVVPSRFVPEPVVPVSAVASARGPDPMVAVLLGIAGASTVALVYSLLPRGPSSRAVKGEPHARRRRPGHP